MSCLWEYLCDDNSPIKRLSAEDYAKLMKSVHLANNISLMAFVKGMTLAEMSLVYTVSEYARNNNGASISVAEAASTLNVSVPAVSRTLKSLEQKQFVLRRIDDNDRRSVRLSVTPDGEKLLRENILCCKRVFDRIMEQFSDDELSQVVRLHCKFSEALAEAAGQQKKHT